MFEKCTLRERIHGINESFIICKCLPQSPLNIQLQLHFKIAQFTKNSFYIYCITGCRITFISHLLLLLLSHFSCVQLCATPETAAHQAPPSLGFSRQEQWSGLPFPSPMHENEKWKWSLSVVFDSSRPHGLQPTRLLKPWDFPGKSTGVGCHRLLLCNSR